MKMKIYFHPRSFSEQRLKSSIITDKVVRAGVLISINEKSVTFQTSRSEVKQSLIQGLLEQLCLEKKYGLVCDSSTFNTIRTT